MYFLLVRHLKLRQVVHILTTVLKVQSPLSSGTFSMHLTSVIVTHRNKNMDLYIAKILRSKVL
jgi:hypothetical protein